MSENIQKSPSLNQMVDAFTHLKQRLEYFERHIQNSNNQEVRKEYFRISILLKSSIMIVTATLGIPDPDAHFER